jgi:hypothetical protein
MQRHRFQDQLEQPRFPRALAPAVNVSAFCACPWSLVMRGSPTAMQWQQRIYQLALAEAQAVVRPSLPERDLLGVWN